MLGVLAGPTTAHTPITTRVTWSAEVGPILIARCAGCHRPGGVAPMPLVTYEQAKPWAKAIKTEIVSGRMPRGQVVRGFGAVRNALSISPFEIALVAAWADGGAPKGVDRPPGFDDGDDLPRPDLRLRVPSRSVPPAGERVTLETDAIRTPRDLWVRGWRFYPNDPAIVHAEFTLPDGKSLGTWSPPDADVQLPEDVGAKLSDGRARVTVLYRSARLQQDFPVAAPRLPPVLGLFTSRARPAREIAHSTSGCGTEDLNADADLLALRPVVDREHAAVAVALALPDRPPLPLVSVRDATAEHQPTYWLRDRISMPAGTRLLVDSDTPGCRIVLTLVRD